MTCSWKTCKKCRSPKSRYCDFHKFIAAKKRPIKVREMRTRIEKYLDYVLGEGFEEPNLELA